MTRNMVNVDNLFIHSLEEYRDMEKRIIEIATINNARAYIRVNRRNTEKMALQTLVQISNLMLNKDYKSVRNAYLSAAGKSNAEPTKRWVVDIDQILSDNEEFSSYVNEVKNYIKELHVECNRNSKQGEYKILLEIPTKNGIHIITNPFNLQKFKQRFPGVLDVHKDNPTILFMPDNTDSWNSLKLIGTPEKWTKMYMDYQDLLTQQDVAGWWQGEYLTADKERTELKAELYKLKNNIK